MKDFIDINVSFYSTWPLEGIFKSELLQARTYKVSRNGIMLCRRKLAVRNDRICVHD